MKIKEGFILREVANNYIVVPVGKLSSDFNGVITLNETGAALWRQLSTETTKEKLVAYLLANYNVDIKTALEDVDSFIKTLEEASLLE